MATIAYCLLSIDATRATFQDKTPHKKKEIKRLNDKQLQCWRALKNYYVEHGKQVWPPTCQARTLPSANRIVSSRSVSITLNPGLNPGVATRHQTTTGCDDALVKSPSMVNCSEHPTKIEIDNDITGIGVIIGYVATAGIVVMIIIVHYLLSFEPRLDPFRKNSPNLNVEFLDRPNPVDELLLRPIRRACTRIFGPHRTTIEAHSQLEQALIKCMLSMSDIQIITGISILVSGASQLQQYLSCYQWQVVVYLAWFSSLTHLSGLTLLRNYLYHRPAQRVWRLCSMLVLIIMLVFALIPTVNYQWVQRSDSSSAFVPGLADYAWCYLNPTNHHLNPGHTGTQYQYTKQAVFAVVLSILLLVLGFMARLFKLHRNASLGLNEKIRGNLSHYLRNWLRRLYNWLDIQGSSRNLKRTMLYRPLLALFLTGRISLDLASSMFFELTLAQVLWLVVSFSWGVSRLFNALDLYHDEENEQWSFGQVMSVALLAIPLVTMVEFLYPDQTHKPKHIPDSDSQSLPVDESPSTLTLPNSTRQVLEHHDPSSQDDMIDHPDWELCYTSGSLNFPISTAILLEHGYPPSQLQSLGGRLSDMALVYMVQRSGILDDPARATWYGQPGKGAPAARREDTAQLELPVILHWDQGPSGDASISPCFSLYNWYLAVERSMLNITWAYVCLCLLSLESTQLTPSRLDQETNRSFVLRAVKDVIFEDRPIPKLNDAWDVRVQVAQTGICGSDVHYWQRGRIGDFVLNSPIVLGHESSGTVVEVGSAVKNVRVGDRVAIEPGVPCRHCNYCRSGSYNLCPETVFAATPPHDGSLSKYYITQSDYCYPLHAHMSLEEVALVEPVAVAVQINSGRRPAQPDRGAYAAKNVIGVDISPSRVDFARTFAADEVFVPPPKPESKDDIAWNEEMARIIKERFDLGEGADVVLEATGAEACIQTGIHLTKKGGTYVQAGMGRERLITNRFKFGQAEEAFELVRQGKESVIKVIIEGVAD
ncbi:hypothetical protein N7492_009642 [Penicillium capsulatum]|uniref:D-xylulose reductase n=1 Tax=Penicillium capsulatum TaxID=69766 RepID=A0A9W9LHW9_9EURO|nr:hypothetical protein N7492_009642 [Penicillium capsulatum]KAJ6107028.1 hypothetical protein N7512_010545 [Penicillium capsulatum]